MNMEAQTSCLNLSIDKQKDQGMDIHITTHSTEKGSASSAPLLKALPPSSRPFSIANILGQMDDQAEQKMGKSDEFDTTAGTSSLEEAPALNNTDNFNEHSDLDITDEEEEQTANDLKFVGLDGQKAEVDGNVDRTIPRTFSFTQAPLFPTAMTSSLLPVLGSMPVHPGSPLNYLDMMNPSVWTSFSQNFINRQIFGLSGKYLLFSCFKK